MLGNTALGESRVLCRWNSGKQAEICLIHDLSPSTDSRSFCFSNCESSSSACSLGAKTHLSHCLLPPSAFANCCEMRARARARMEERVFAHAEAFCFTGIHVLCM